MADLDAQGFKLVLGDLLSDMYVLKAQAAQQINGLAAQRDELQGKLAAAEAVLTPAQKAKLGLSDPPEGPAAA